MQSCCSALMSVTPSDRHTHTDCDRYKAVIYLNGDKVQEMFDFSLHELKERLRQKISELDATSSTLLTKAVLWTSEPWDSATEAVQIQAT